MRGYRQYDWDGQPRPVDWSVTAGVPLTLCLGASPSYATYPAGMTRQIAFGFSSSCGVDVVQYETSEASYIEAKFEDGRRVPASLHSEDEGYWKWTSTPSSASGVRVLQGGAHRICVCPTLPCDPENPEAFFVDAGPVNVEGPVATRLPDKLPGESWTLTLPFVNADDEVLVYDDNDGSVSCGGFLPPLRRLGKTDGGAWSMDNFEMGSYLICWCAGLYEFGCDYDDYFAVEAATFSIVRAPRYLDTSLPSEPKYD